MKRVAILVACAVALASSTYSVALANTTEISSFKLNFSGVLDTNFTNTQNSSRVAASSVTDWDNIQLRELDMTEITKKLNDAGCENPLPMLATSDLKSLLFADEYTSPTQVYKYSLKDDTVTKIYDGSLGRIPSDGRVGDILPIYDSYSYVATKGISTVTGDLIDLDSPIEYSTGVLNKYTQSLLTRLGYTYSDYYKNSLNNYNSWSRSTFYDFNTYTVSAGEMDLSLLGIPNTQNSKLDLYRKYYPYFAIPSSVIEFPLEMNGVSVDGHTVNCKLNEEFDIDGSKYIAITDYNGKTQTLYGKTIDMSGRPMGFAGLDTLTVDIPVSFYKVENGNYTKVGTKYVVSQADIKTKEIFNTEVFDTYNLLCSFIDSSYYTSVADGVIAGRSWIDGYKSQKYVFNISTNKWEASDLANTDGSPNMYDLSKYYSLLSTTTSNGDTSLEIVSPDGSKIINVKDSNNLQYSAKLYQAPQRGKLFVYGQSSNSDYKYFMNYGYHYNVTFKDSDGSTLDTQSVYEGDSATAPQVPQKEGYSFTGWDISFANVESDLTVTAQYSKNAPPVSNQYTVTFEDWDGTVLSSQIVNGGSDATPPTPHRDGYTFEGWTEPYVNVWSNRTPVAIYSDGNAPTNPTEPTTPTQPTNPNNPTPPTNPTPPSQSSGSESSGGSSGSKGDIIEVFKSVDDNKTVYTYEGDVTNADTELLGSTGKSYSWENKTDGITGELTVVKDTVKNNESYIITLDTVPNNDTNIKILDVLKNDDAKLYSHVPSIDKYALIADSTKQGNDALFTTTKSTKYILTKSDLPKENTVTGWYKLGYNKWTFFDKYKDTPVTGWHTAVQNEWVHNGKDIAGDRFNLDSTGVMRYGWYQDSDGSWYYLDDLDKSRVYGGTLEGWYYINNNWFYFDKSKGCKMTTGWTKIDNDWYYFDNNGYMLSNTTVDGYTLNEHGALV